MAVHFREIEPKYGFGASTTVPFFGALTSSLDTTTSQQPLPERTGGGDMDTPEMPVGTTC